MKRYNSFETVEAFLNKKPIIKMAVPDEVLKNKPTKGILLWILENTETIDTVSKYGKVLGRWKRRTMGDLYRLVRYYNGDTLKNVYNALYSVLRDSCGTTFVCGDISKRVYVLNFPFQGRYCGEAADEFCVHTSALAKKYVLTFDTGKYKTIKLIEPQPLVLC